MFAVRKMAKQHYPHRVCNIQRQQQSKGRKNDPKFIEITCFSWTEALCFTEHLFHELCWHRLCCLFEMQPTNCYIRIKLLTLPAFSPNALRRQPLLSYSVLTRKHIRKDRQSLHVQSQCADSSNTWLRYLFLSQKVYVATILPLIFTVPSSRSRVYYFSLSQLALCSASFCSTWTGGITVCV